MCLSRATKNNKRVSPTAQVTFNIFLKAKHFSVCSSCCCCPCSLSLNDSSCCSFCSSCTLLYIEVFCIPCCVEAVDSRFACVFEILTKNKSYMHFYYSYYVYICMYIYIYCIYLTCNNTASHRIDKGHFKMEKMQLHAKGR